MKRKHVFITSLTMWIGVSVLILLSYALFLFVVFNGSELSIGLWMLCIFGTIVLPTTIPFTNAQRWFTVVVLDEKSITQKLFGVIKIRTIEWDLVSEIRLSTYMGGWIFFSKRPLDNIFYDDIVKRKDVIQIGFSKKLVNVIKEHTDKQIIGYDED